MIHHTTYSSRVRSSMDFVYKLPAHLAKTAQKVADFVKRHSKTFTLYGIIAVALALTGNPLARITATLLPGFGWNLSFSEGSKLPSDFLKKHRAGTPLSTWIPTSLDQATSPALQKRYQTLEKVKHQLGITPPGGRTLIFGKTGAGKSSCLEPLAESLTLKGHTVFYLEKNEVLKAGRLRGFLDDRFTTIVLYLNAIALSSLKPPVLIIDEYQRMVDPTSPGFNDCLKDTFGFPLKFNILATLSDEDLERVNSQDKASMRRFGRRKYRLDDLDSTGITETLIHAKPHLSTELIDYARAKIEALNSDFPMTDICDLLNKIVGTVTKEKIDFEVSMLGT